MQPEFYVLVYRWVQFRSPARWPKTPWARGMAAQWQAPKLWLKNALRVAKPLTWSILHRLVAVLATHTGVTLGAVRCVTIDSPELNRPTSLIRHLFAY
jgi:hypothetical protein